jgi:hypothetical protein
MDAKEIMRNYQKIQVARQENNNKLNKRMKEE